MKYKRCVRFYVGYIFTCLAERLVGAVVFEF